MSNIVDTLSGPFVKKNKASRLKLKAGVNSKLHRYTVNKNGNLQTKSEETIHTLSRGEKMVIKDGDGNGVAVLALIDGVPHLVINDQLRPVVHSSRTETDMDVEPNGDDRYEVKSKRWMYKPTQEDTSEEFELPEFETTREFMEWLEDKDRRTKEIVRQIYTHRWTFETGTKRDHSFLTIVEEELNR